jgi:deoxyribodipyrimidine photo-lyase
MDSALVWFRRDLRLHDHAALYHALKNARRVYCVFVFDRAILDPLLDDGAKADRRVEFILGAVEALAAALRRHDSALLVHHGVAAEVIAPLAAQLGVDAVFANHDDEPYALQRDAQVAARLAAEGRRWQSFKDHVIFERAEVLTGSGTPFSVFTPYKNAWLKKLRPFYLSSYGVENHAAALAQRAEVPALPTLAALGFEKTNLQQLKIEPTPQAGEQLFEDFLGRIDDYRQARDYPAVKGPSYLSVHLRFGTVSIRTLARAAQQRAERGSEGAATWLSELIWRDFYHQILAHHPRVVGHAFKPAYDRIRWDDRPEWFAAWCEGRTGYPLVDAAMAQLNQTGYMHNRLRMVTASFLTKDLGIDWRLGEGYFARQLIDYDLAANNGGWQWAASTGCDAQPYFRIFNPVSQSQKFDPDGKFIKRYLPQLAALSSAEIHAPWEVPPLRQQHLGCVIGVDYPTPLVDHAQARAATLARFAVVKEAA